MDLVVCATHKSWSQVTGCDHNSQFQNATTDVMTTFMLRTPRETYDTPEANIFIQQPQAHFDREGVHRVTLTNKMKEASHDHHGCENPGPDPGAFRRDHDLRSQA